jgi:hypothetical protein
VSRYVLLDGAAQPVEAGYVVALWVNADPQVIEARSDREGALRRLQGIVGGRVEFFPFELAIHAVRRRFVLAVNKDLPHRLHPDRLVPVLESWENVNTTANALACDPIGVVRHQAYVLGAAVICLANSERIWELLSITDVERVTRVLRTMGCGARSS